MSFAQQPPFLICVPIRRSKAWPGLAAREIEALLDRLGNPADPAVRAALDATGVIHFLSLSVVWDEHSKDPPILVADVAGDGPPWSVISRLVEHAGAILLPVYQAAAGVDCLSTLQLLLERYWVKPVAAAAPLFFNRATGLPFQGTPGLTAQRIHEDEVVARAATDSVFGHTPRGPSAALSHLQAARTAAGIVNPKGPPFVYSDEAPSLSSAGFLAKASTIFSLVVFDWSFLFIILFAVFYLNVRDLLNPILNTTPSNFYETFLTIPFAILFGFFFNVIVINIKLNVHVKLSDKKFFRLSLLALIPIAFAAWGSVRLSKVFSQYKLPPAFVQNLHVPLFTWLAGVIVRALHAPLFAWWVGIVLGFLSLVIFLMLVAGALLFILRRHEASDKPCDADPDPRRVAEIIRREDLPPHRQNHMIAISTISPGLFRRFVFLPAGLYAASLTVRAGIFRTGFLARIGTIHFIQWARVPGTRKLVFTANYDNSWQSYLEDAITLLPGGATGIWSNTKGFPKTSWLFSDGAADGDRFKRWVRRQMIPTRFWYSAYPHLSTTDIRLNAAIRLGLEAATMTASEADVWLNLFGTVPRPVSEIETDEIQGLALSGYRNLVEGGLLAVSFPENQAAACRAWLESVRHRIDFGDAGQSETAMAVALSARGLARLGLAASDPLAARFLPAFAMGMANEARANVLGDVDRNSPERWEWGGPDDPIDAVLLVYAVDQQTLQTRLSDEATACTNARMAAPHRIVLRQWPQPRDGITNSPIPIKEPFGFVDGISQPSIKGLLSSRGALKTDLLEPGEFILGYPDGLEEFPPTPQVFGIDDPDRLLPDLPPNFPPPPSTVDAKPGHAPALRDLGRNGSYLVIRQLKQDVRGFNNYLEEAAAKVGETADWVAAKMVGRWKDGAPLVLAPLRPPPTYNPFPKNEKFLFGRDDPQGLACPFGAHIRRANPRDQFDADDRTQMKITNRHRIIRRGRAYVDGTDSGAAPQGLLFMCLNADIERQFEFLQQTWIGSTSFGPLGNEADPLTALNRTGGTYTIPTLTGPKQISGMPSFVTVIGGGYFFLPGRQALNFLSR